MSEDQFGNQYNYDKNHIGPTIIWKKSGLEYYYINGKRYSKEEYYKIKNANLQRNLK